MTHAPEPAIAPAAAIAATGPRRRVRFAIFGGFAAGVALGSVLVIAGCGAASQQPGETLALSIKNYTEGVRWERYTSAASLLPPTERAAFVDAWDVRAKNVKVTDYELVQISSQDSKRARVQVKISWYVETEGTFHETTAAQAWERKGKVWWLVEQHRLRGPEMPGLPEPDPDADKNDDYADPNDAAALAADATQPG